MLFRSVCETLKRTVPADEVEWRVFGRFPKDAKAFSLFQSTWWEASVAKHKELEGKIQARALGLDVAGSEAGDYCALAWGDHKGCQKIDLIRNPNLMMLKGEIYHMASQNGIELKGGYVPVAIDCMAMGAGLADAMEMDGVYIIRVGGSSAAVRGKEIYMNRRAEVYGELAASLNPQLIQKQPWALPDDDFLREELFSLERIYLTGQKFKLNSKRKLDAASKARNQDNRDSVEEKIGRSPDRSDAVSYLLQAVRETPEYFDEVVDQFDPTKYIRSFQDLGCGEMLVTLFDGKVTKIPKDIFHEKYGENPSVLQF